MATLSALTDKTKGNTIEVACWRKLQSCNSMLHQLSKKSLDVCSLAPNGGNSSSTESWQRKKLDIQKQLPGQQAEINKVGKINIKDDADTKEEAVAWRHGYLQF